MPLEKRSPGEWQPTPVFLPKKSHAEEPGGLRLRGCEESDMAEHTHFAVAICGMGAVFQSPH